MKNLLPLCTRLLPAMLAAAPIASAHAQTSTAPALYVNDSSTSGDVFTSAIGSDATGDGSAAAPFATVAQALALAGPATQTIFIDAGTYTERVVLNKPVSLQGAGTATAQPTSATIFDGGLLPAATQTSEAGLRLTVSGGTSSQPLTIADITFQAYDFGIQSEGSGPQANLLLEDVETVHNRRQGIFWNSLSGVQRLTLRRVRAAYTAEGSNSTANGAGRGFFLVNGHKADILVEDGDFSFNRRSGVDINDGSVSGLTVRNCQFQQNEEPALAVLGAGGARAASGSFMSIAALLEGNTIRTSSANGLELKSCTGTGTSSGPGSFVVRTNTIVRVAGASASLNADKAGVLFIDRDRGIIAGSGGLTGDLVTGGAFFANNTIRGYWADATSSAAYNNGFGLVLEGANNKVFGNVIAQCQHAIQVQDRPANSTGATPFFDISRNGLVVSSGDSIRGNRLDSCAVAIRAVNLTNPVDASLNWLGAATAATVRGAAGTGARVVTLSGPPAGFTELSALAPTGLVDYSPFLSSAAAASAAVGFQLPLDYLIVDHDSPQSGSATPLAEGLALVAEKGTLRLEAAAYNEALTLTKNLTLQPDGATTLRDLTLAGTGKVLTLAAPLTITGALTLNNGLVHTTALAVLTLADQATATSGNATSYVDGPLRKVGQQAFVFPVGSKGQWARLGISAPASPGTAFTAEYLAYAHPAATSVVAPLNNVSQVEHWTLDGNGTSDAVQVRLFWEDAFRSGLDDFSADVQVATFSGSRWETAGNGGLGGSLSAGSVVSAQPVSTFEAFTLGSLSSAVNPLSRQLLQFAASQSRPQQVDLSWTLSDETNTYGYAVERSDDGAKWQQIGFVASKGLTSQACTYTYQDQAVQGLQKAFYRLAQATAKATRYSPVAAITLSGSALATQAPTQGILSVFPNPASGQVTLRLPAAASASAQLLLTDLSGRTVLSQPLRGATETLVHLPASLGTGIYLLRVQDAGISSKPQRLVIY